MSTKESLLRMLREEEGCVSGQELAERLGVSRNAVWKAMEQLRRDGYQVEAVTNRGYRLVSAPEELMEGEIREWLRTERIGRFMEVHSSIASTNTRAKALAMEGAQEGTLVVAESQTGGRGRMGRSFFSPAHSGVYLSFVLRPAMPAERATLLTSLAAVAVARAIERLAPDVNVQIKWVNDLYLRGKKICGILCEAGIGLENAQLEYAVLGIGINVKRMTFPPELQAIATAIENESSVTLSRNRLIAEIANELEAMLQAPEWDAFLPESRRRSNVIGHMVTVIQGNQTYPAKALDIDGEGQLVIETERGISRIGYGEVSLRLEGKETRTHE